jgi:hypothetical protein
MAPGQMRPTRSRVSTTMLAQVMGIPVEKNLLLRRSGPIHRICGRFRSDYRRIHTAICGNCRISALCKAMRLHWRQPAAVSALPSDKLEPRFRPATDRPALETATLGGNGGRDKNTTSVGATGSSMGATSQCCRASQLTPDDTARTIVPGRRAGASWSPSATTGIE